MLHVRMLWRLLARHQEVVDAYCDPGALELPGRRLDALLGTGHPAVVAQVFEPGLVEEELLPVARVLASPTAHREAETAKAHRG